MSNYFSDHEDLQFYFNKAIDWAKLIPLVEHNTQEHNASTLQDTIDFYRQAAEMFGQFVAEGIAPYAQEIDRQGVQLVDGEVVSPARVDTIFAHMRQLDLHRICIPRELGGMNSSVILYFIFLELLARAEPSVSHHYAFHTGISMIMLALSIQEGTTTWDAQKQCIQTTRFRQEIEEISRGDAWGAMDITEPDAGSDMAALRCIGEQDEQGNWFVSGQKIFITSGHGKYHFVIARTEKTSDKDDSANGLAGLSLFLVKTYEDNEQGQRIRYASIDRIEEKLGHHGSVTATLTFDRTPALLVGKRGEGFRYMLTLMNNARISVGFEAIGLCEQAYALAKSYAAQRPSMGKMIDQHEMIADYLEQMRCEIWGLRALAMDAAFHEEMHQRYQFQLSLAPPTHPAERKKLEKKLARHKARARQLTPLLKYVGSEKAVEMARKCIQIHGGNGYIREYGAEKLLRDAIVMPIYEGTSQIQALMVVKDMLGNILKNPQGFVRRLAQIQWRSLSARDPLERRVAKLQALAFKCQQVLLRKTASDKFRSIQQHPMGEWPQKLRKGWNPKRDFAYAMLHAERLTRLLAEVAICKQLLKQAQAYTERREILERYLVYAEPRCRSLHDEITTTGDYLLQRLASTQEQEKATTKAAS